MEFPFDFENNPINHLMGDNNLEKHLSVLQKYEIKSQWEWKTVSWDLNDPAFKLSLCRSFWDLFVIYLIWWSYYQFRAYFFNLFWAW